MHRVVALSILFLIVAFIAAPLGAQTTVAPPATFAPNNSAPATTPAASNPAVSTPAAATPSPATTQPKPAVPSASIGSQAPTAPSATIGSQPPTATPAPAGGGSFAGQWRSPTGETGASGNLAPKDGLTTINGSPRTPLAKVTAGSGTLPNQNGQIWREYDISPYTSRVTSTNRPEQAIVDWILRETGYEAWHSSVVSILAADAKTLRVYHIPEIHAIVADVVDRFLRTGGDTQAVNVRIVSVDGPSWRAKAQQVLRPVPVQTQGIQAWLLAREDASLLGADLRKRMYFRELGSPQLYITSGQSAVLSQTRPRPYTADVVMRSDVWPGYETKASQYDEGFSVEISPLGSLDGKSLDAVIKVSIDQVERMQSLTVDVPSVAAPRQRTKIDVPQISQFRMHDRFRWPVDQVLLVSLGVIPLPSADAAVSSGLRLPEALGGGPDRGEVLMFIECRNSALVPATAAPAPAAFPGTAPVPAVPSPAPTTPPVTSPFTIPALPKFNTPAILGGLPANVPVTPSKPRY
jgi:hypothetical protein